MPYRYFVSIALLLAAVPASAQFVPAGSPVTNLQASSITATSATITFTGGSAGGGPAFGCQAIPTIIQYAYAGGPWISVPYAMPAQLTGLQPNSAVSVQVIRSVSNQLSAGPACGPAPATITFNTLAAPLAAVAAAEAGQFTLAPNPAQHRTTLTLAAAPLQPTPVLVLDALGRPVRQQVLPARATTAALEVAGLPAGLYSVRCGTAVRRLVVE